MRICKLVAQQTFLETLQEKRQDNRSFAPPPCSSSLRKHTSRAYYVAKVWRNARTPFQDIDSFTNYCWYPDGSIDWIDTPYPNDVADLYGENDCTQDRSCDDLEEDEGLEDSDIDDEEQD